MTNRERLIELLDKKQYQGNAVETSANYIQNSELADYLLSNGVIALPCKVGDEVYVIDVKQPCHACYFSTDFCHKDCSFPDRLDKVIKKATVEKIEFESNRTTITVNVPETEIAASYKIEFLSTDFNKTIFFSEEAAEEAKLKELHLSDLNRAFDALGESVVEFAKAFGNAFKTIFDAIEAGYSTEEVLDIVEKEDKNESM